jgi:hypothetical protein
MYSLISHSAQSASDNDQEERDQPLYRPDPVWASGDFQSSTSNTTGASAGRCLYASGCKLSSTSLLTGRGGLLVLPWRSQAAFVLPHKQSSLLKPQQVPASHAARSSTSATQHPRLIPGGIQPSEDHLLVPFCSDLQCIVRAPLPKLQTCHHSGLWSHLYPAAQHLASHGSFRAADPAETKDEDRSAVVAEQRSLIAPQ